MATQTRKMTASEFLVLPVSNQFHELIHGEEVKSFSRTGTHQRFSARTLFLLDHLIPHGEIVFSPIDVYLYDENIVQPDILWIAEGSAAKWIEDRYIQGAPDLVVEVYSPGTARRDVSSL